jgi:hypothetical protein
LHVLHRIARSALSDCTCAAHASRQQKEKITDVYAGLDTTVGTFPADSVGRDADAYKAALDQLSPGDVTTIFTPDDTHFRIAKCVACEWERNKNT